MQRAEQRRRITTEDGATERIDTQLERAQSVGEHVEQGAQTVGEEAAGVGVVIVTRNLRTNRKVTDANVDQRTEALRFAPVPGKAALYVFRSQFVGRAVGINVLVDGRETAPSTATAGYFTVNGQNLGYLQAVYSGKSVGVPGAIALYKAAHEKYGNLPWGVQFDAAIRLADEGFIVSPRLANSLTRPPTS